MLSVIIPVYNEEKQIEKTIKEVKSVTAQLDEDFEIIVIDDGSSDNTWHILKGLAGKNPEVSAFRFSRNFGKEAAIMAGLSNAKGDACITMDADLQHPPELIPEMIRFWKEGFEVVEAVKKDRGKETPVSSFSASLFYKIMHRLSGFNLQNARTINFWTKSGSRNSSNARKGNLFRGSLPGWAIKEQKYISAFPKEKQENSWSKLKLFRLAITCLYILSSLRCSLLRL